MGSCLGVQFQCNSGNPKHLELFGPTSTSWWDRESLMESAGGQLSVFLPLLALLGLSTFNLSIKNSPTVDIHASQKNYGIFDFHSLNQFKMLYIKK